jgi:hypothetical protein
MNNNQLASKTGTNVCFIMRVIKFKLYFLPANWRVATTTSNIAMMILLSYYPKIKIEFEAQKTSNSNN